MDDTENERPQECYNFHGFRDFLKKYKSKLQNVSHCDRHRHLNRSRSFVLPRNNVKDKAQLDHLKADTDKNKDSGVKYHGKNGEKELNQKSQKHGKYGNHIVKSNNNNNNNNYHDINNGCFKTIILVNAPKKKQAPSKVSTSDLSDDNFASIEKEENVTPSNATSFEAKPPPGRLTSTNNGTKTQQQGAKTPNNSRAASMNRTFSRGSGTNSFNNGRVNSNNTNAPPRHVNRSTSMNISRSTSNNGNVVMSSFRSFNKSRSGHIIMFSNSSGMLKPPAMEQELECTLEELCHGCVKKIRVSRDIYSWTGQRTQEEEVLTVNVKPGWKAGTKITFEGTTTDDKPGEYRADVVFIVTEKPHRLFQRNGDDLEMEMEIPLVDALTGCTLTIPLLEGEKMTMGIDDVVFPGYEKVMVGRGMPNQKNPHHKGDLKIKLLVDFPKSLSEERRSQVFKIFSSVNFES